MYNSLGAYEGTIQIQNPKNIFVETIILSYPTSPPRIDGKIKVGKFLSLL